MFSLCFLLLLFSLLHSATFSTINTNSATYDPKLFGLCFIGDSVTMKVYNAILTNSSNKCVHNANPHDIKNDVINAVTHCNNTHNTGFLTAMRHWGVSRTVGDYWPHWIEDYYGNHSNNSQTNVKRAIWDFQRHCKDPEACVFVFLSSLWDITKFSIIQCNRSSHLMNTGKRNFLTGYKSNYTELVKSDILPLLRANDHLFIYLMHEPKYNKKFVHDMNRIASEIAAKFHVPIFDSGIIMGEYSTATSMDDLHQNDLYANKLSLSLRRHIRHYLKEVHNGRW